jgi:hypothetical protein
MSDLCSDHTAAHLFEFVERSVTEMPADYLPEAPGVMFAGEDMLRAAGYVPGSNRPRGWCRLRPGNYRRYVGEHILTVRQCGSASSATVTCRSGR